MDSLLLVYTAVFALLFFAYPAELRSLGLSVEYMLQLWLKDPMIDYLLYHSRRTSANLLIHSFLPFLYIIGLQIFGIGLPDSLLTCCLTLGVITVTYGLIHFLKFNISPFSSWHPINRVLYKYSRNIENVRCEINDQFISLDSYHTDNGSFRLTITRDWLLSPNYYQLNIAKLEDCKINIIDSHTLDVVNNPSIGRQFVKFQVSSLSHNFSPFLLTLNSLDYNDFKLYLPMPIENLRNVIIRQTLSDQFLEAFVAHVRVNPLFREPNLHHQRENCLGCLNKPAEVKINRTCGDNVSVFGLARCNPCRCRPLWCVECLGKWFASRQDQSKPNTWLSGKAPCPMCRQLFCMLDVCFLSVNN